MKKRIHPWLPGFLLALTSKVFDLITKLRGVSGNTYQLHIV
jgi:hypothetical protein